MTQYMCSIGRFYLCLGCCQRCRVRLIGYLKDDLTSDDTHRVLGLFKGYRQGLVTFSCRLRCVFRRICLPIRGSWGSEIRRDCHA